MMAMYCGVTGSKDCSLSRYVTVDGKLHRVGHRLSFHFITGSASSFTIRTGLAGTTTLHTFALPRFCHATVPQGVFPLRLGLLS
jgi:hypothetical protein